MTSADGLTVRWAEADDRDTVVCLLSEIVRFHGEQPDARKLDISFEQSIACLASFRFALAFRGGVPVGQFPFHIIYSTWSGAPYAFIQDFYVVAEKRGSGTADAMMRFGIEQARLQGMCRVELEVLEDNARARRFYERHGFEVTRYRTYKLPVQQTG